ncbi:hypothetical protein GCM10009760_52540 [Kitasatospora kazusensis]|uniref:Uncharacterized protein n=1 Tax=Kitasatospora kazusensis TaxID=407974 RepID=A0ABN3A510_9ACTN
MSLAPMPDHRRINDPYWLRLFENYSHIIRPLRERGFVTDFETCGGAYYIHAALPDGSHLSIASDEALPSNPHDVKGWRVCRHHDDNPTISDLIYDSTFAGSDLLNSQLRSPLFAAVDAYLLARGLTEPWRAAFQPVALRFQHITADGTPRSPVLRPYVEREYAAQAYDVHHQSLPEDGWHRIYIHPSREWPRSVWMRGDALLHLGVTAAEFATSTDTDRG